MDTTKPEILLATLHETDEKRPGTSPDAETRNVVDFTEGDPGDPINWSSFRKWSIAAPVALMSLINIFATCAIIPAAPQVTEGLHTADPLYRTLLVSIWELGEGISPLLAAPLAERFGRAPVFHVGNAVSVIWLVAGALSTNIQMLIAFRFLNGVSSTTLTLGPAIIADLFVSEQRGAAMAAVMGFDVLGSFVAPICGAFVAARLGWRWCIWISAIAVGSVEVACLFVIRETYAVKILQRRTKRLREETGDPSLESKHQAHLDSTTVLQTITMPLLIMAKSPGIFLVSLYTAVVYGSMYLVVTTLTEIMEQRYSFSHGVVGLAFVPLAIGNTLGMLSYGLTSDAYHKRQKKRLGERFKLESRLVHTVFAAALLPLAFILYGWTLQFRVQWAAPLVAVGLVAFCTVNVMLSTETYLTDAYPIRGASAIAAGVILRAICGAVYPLSGPPLYSHLGQGWGNTVLAFVLLPFLAVMIVLLKHGAKLRWDEEASLRRPDHVAGGS